ncbi:phage head closure protein [Collimonas sp.]|jgi:SPP1 family predicted phage head-tail adaptor|uniref:phage head closure protein n=1 Tax=Collimonas sp. TaxID=1963772 RepID=UPI002BEC1E31|nr:phage head closure protein [Collimonas sp.]HWX01442.1 phage head closure protein [Collimonas sp.]
MQAGQLRHKTVIQSPPSGQDDDGNPRTEWLLVSKPYAKKEDLSGRELFAAQAAQSEVTTRFRIRYRTGVTAKMRLLCDGVIYNIEAVLDRDGRKRELQLMCSSGLNNG